MGMEGSPWELTLKTLRRLACHQVQLVHHCSTDFTCCVLQPNSNWLSVLHDACPLLLCRRQPCLNLAGWSIARLAIYAAIGAQADMVACKYRHKLPAELLLSQVHGIGLLCTCIGTRHPPSLPLLMCRHPICTACCWPGHARCTLTAAVRRNGLASILSPHT